MSKVKILVLTADPQSALRNTPRLLLDEEAREIRQKLRTSTNRDAVELHVRGAARTGDLVEAMDETRPQVLHFSGHAKKEGILLVGPDGRTPFALDADRLLGLLRAFRAELRLVVLSACWSLAHAEALTAIVDCAIGTRTLISDEAAIVFNTAFYGALASGHSVQDAFDQASEVLRLGDFGDEEHPELVVRPGVDASRVVLVPAGGAGSGRPAPPPLSVSPTVFAVPSFDREKNLVAVMMPFAREYDRTFQAIQEACDALGLRCQRGDSGWEESMIVQDVFNLIYRSAVVVADLSGRSPNPNVMYECGIAHTLGRPVVLISHGTQAPPFDVAHHRILGYLPNAEGLAEMRAALEVRLRALVPAAADPPHPAAPPAAVPAP